MNKTELVAAIAEQADMTKKDAEKALTAFTEVVTKELKKGGKIQLVGFGTFEVAERAAREENYALRQVFKGVEAYKAPHCGKRGV